MVDSELALAIAVHKAALDDRNAEIALICAIFSGDALVEQLRKFNDENRRSDFVARAYEGILDAHEQIKAIQREKVALAASGKYAPGKPPTHIEPA